MTATPTSWERSIELLDQLPTLPHQQRVEAVELLFRSSSPMVRERALRTGAVVLADDRIEAYLRSDTDDVARNAGLEMLKLRGPRGVALAIRLLRDDDHDVVLQAVLALGHTRDLRALEPLRGALAHDDPNVAQAAIEAVGRLGDARAVADLLPFLRAEPWFQMAAIQALGELRDRTALAPLGALLTDLLVGPLAAEAVARIGGADAFRRLASHIVHFGDASEGEGLLALLAHVLEGLRTTPGRVEGLEVVLRTALHSDELGEQGRAATLAAARCLLALGPTDEDEAAVLALAAGEVESLHLPTCLERRADLVVLLLALPGAPRCWGLLLLERHPRAASDDQLAAALGTANLVPDLVKVASRALAKRQRHTLATALLERYRRGSTSERRALVPLLATQRRHLPKVLEAAPDLELEDRLLLAARAGVAGDRLPNAIGALGAEQRHRVLEQLVDLPELTRGLPWGSWLAQDPDRWSELAALVAAQHGLRELLLPLRERLATNPTPALLRAVGELGDRDSLPQLTALIEAGDPRIVPLALEAAGQIGGPEARRLLRTVITTRGPEERMAYRALSICAAPEDDEIFRSAVTHADWYVRLACADVLGRYARPENLEALAELAADSVPLVAQRALASIERV
jgi:HEAT repeat protein